MEHRSPGSFIKCGMAAQAGVWQIRNRPRTKACHAILDSDADFALVHCPNFEVNVHSRATKEGGCAVRDGPVAYQPRLTCLFW